MRPISTYLLLLLLLLLLLSFRRLRAIDFDKFFSDLEDSMLIRTPLNDDLSLAIDQFNSTLQSIIDNHAPIIRRPVTLRPYAAWFTDEIKATKTKRRKLERRWRVHNTEANHQLYTEHCRVVNGLIRCAAAMTSCAYAMSGNRNQKNLVPFRSAHAFKFTHFRVTKFNINLQAKGKPSLVTRLQHLIREEALPRLSAQSFFCCTLYMLDSVRAKLFT